MNIHSGYYIRAILAIVLIILAGGFLDSAMSADGYELTIRVYQKDTWQGNRGDWIEDAHVKLINYGSNRYEYREDDKTDEDGKVKFEEIPAGQYQVIVYKDNCPQYSEVYVMPGYDTVKNVGYDCRTGYKLTVQVYQKDTWQGNQGQWIQYAKVKLTNYGQNTYGYTQEVQTDQYGKAVFYNVPVGQYNVNVYKDNCPQYNEVYVMPAYDAVKNVGYDCLTGYKYTVQVYQKDTWQGNQGQWIQYAKVKLTNYGQNSYAYSKEVETDQYGKAVFYNVPVGQYNVNVYKDNCPQYNEVYVMPAYDAVKNVGYDCLTGYKYTVQVYQKDTWQGNQGQWIQYAKVKLTNYGQNSYAYSKEVETDQYGKAVFYNLPVGQYNVNVYKDNCPQYNEVYVMPAYDAVKNVGYDCLTGYKYTVQVYQKDTWQGNQGQWIQYAKVKLTNYGQNSYAYSKEVETDQYGKAVFYNLPVGQYNVNVYKDNCPQYNEVYVMPAYDAVKNVGYDCLTGYKYTVQVYQKDTWQGNQGQWIQYAKVKLTNYGQNTYAYTKEVETDQYGKAVFYNLPVGQYKVNVYKDDCPQYNEVYVMPAYDATKNVELYCDERKQGYKLAFRVYYKGTWQGNRGDWVEDAKVKLTNYGGNSYEYREDKDTDEDGKVTFKDVPAGQYQVTVYKEDCVEYREFYNMPAYETTKNLELYCEKEKKGYDLAFRVYYKGTWQGNRGDWVEDAKVKLTNYGGNSYEYREDKDTDEDGKVTFKDVPAGQYQVTVYKEDCVEYREFYNMPAYETTKNLELYCEKEKKGYDLAFRVYYKGTWQGNRGDWVEDAKVKLVHYGGNGYEYDKDEKTDEDGKVKFKDVPAGQYQVTVYKEDCVEYREFYNMPAYDATKNLELYCNDQKQGYKLTVRVYKQGTWRGNEGDWIEEAKVKISSYGGNGSSYSKDKETDEDGKAVFEDLPPGQYQVTIDKSDCYDVREIYVMPGYHATKNYELRCED